MALTVVGNHSDPVRAQRAADWIEALLVALGSEQLGDKWMCPAHDGNSPALSVSTGASAAIVYCHGGCDLDQILTSLGLARRHLYDPPAAIPASVWRRTRIADLTVSPISDDLRTGTGGGSSLDGYLHESDHPYGAEAIKVRFRHPETGKKAPRWRSINPETGQWGHGLHGRKERDLPLYRETEVTAALDRGDPVILCESESSCDALAAAGIEATTWCGGASSPYEVPLTRVLGGDRGGRVVIVPDRDLPGITCAKRLRLMLPLAKVRVPDVDGDDAKDLLGKLGAEAMAAEIRNLTSSPADTECPHCKRAIPTRVIEPHMTKCRSNPNREGS